jgi:hypothetical protein
MIEALPGGVGDKLRSQAITQAPKLISPVPITHKSARNGSGRSLPWSPRQVTWTNNCQHLKNTAKSRPQGHASVQTIFDG